MGLASSMGLGIALARPQQRVVVLDGDGSVLMNLGALTTLAHYRTANVLHIVFDNERFLSIGGPRTATAAGSDLASIAAAAGIPRSCTVRTIDDFVQAVRGARDAHELTTIVAKVDAVGPSVMNVMNVDLLENRFRVSEMASRDMMLSPFTALGHNPPVIAPEDCAWR